MKMMPLTIRIPLPKLIYVYFIHYIITADAIPWGFGTSEAIHDQRLTALQDLIIFEEVLAKTMGKRDDGKIVELVNKGVKFKYYISNYKFLRFELKLTWKEITLGRENPPGGIHKG